MQSLEVKNTEFLRQWSSVRIAHDPAFNNGDNFLSFLS